MSTSSNLLRSFINAAGVFLYTLAVAWTLFHTKELFGEPPGFFIPLFILLLFIISATITGLLVLGKPIHLYLDGFKKEALVLLFTTLAWLILFLVAIIIVLFFV